MKKLLCLLAIISVNSFASTTVNLNSNKFTCNKQVLTNNSSESMMTANCKHAQVKTSEDVTAGHNATKISGGGSDQIQDDDATQQDTHYAKISFITDNGIKLRCYFKNGNLQKCKTLKMKPTASKSN